MKLKVTLNGTAENPWHRLGFKQNPIPQIAKYEYVASCLLVQKLGGDPIPNVEYIRTVLQGFSPEFIDLCCREFKPGQKVSFYVEWKD